LPSAAPLQDYETDRIESMACRRPNAQRCVPRACRPAWLTKT